MVKALQQRGVAVYLLSGGFHSIIETVAEQLNIPSTNIKANKLKFFYNGNASFAHVHTHTCYCVCACILDLSAHMAVHAVHRSVRGLRRDAADVRL